MMFSRRAFLGCGTRLGVLAAASALSACTLATSGSLTTLTLDVAKVKTYGQAGLNAAATVMDLLAPIPALAPYAAGVQAACAGLSAALGAFSTAVGPALAAAPYTHLTLPTISSV